MKRRIFIAINLPKDIKGCIAKEVSRLAPQFTDQSVRFLKSENWHLTIVFLGYQDEQNIHLTAQVMQKTAQSFPPPKIELEKIVYGPFDPYKNKLVSPRMIWLLGSQKTSKQLEPLQKELENNLLDSGVAVQRENRLFNAHLTLARFELPSKSLPPLEKSLTLRFTASSLDLMESTLKRSGAEYEVISAFAFK